MIVLGVSKLVLVYPYPIDNEEQILELYETAFQENSNIKLALIGEKC